MRSKMHKYIVILLLIALKIHLARNIGDEDIRCVASSCKDAECSDVPAKCMSNETNAGIYMLSPDICNCCPYCLVNLAEGEACSVGDPSNAKHTTVCGPGLTCVVAKEGDVDGTCQKMSTPCALEQQSYDARKESGTLGTMETRAVCNDDGLYGNYKCIPGQTCHCLHSNGSRIFGEANFNTIANYMTCAYDLNKNNTLFPRPACSRAYYDAVDILGRHLRPHEHFRCAADGSYDRLQCINEKCLCVDAADGAPTYPKNDLVALEKIDKDNLPCYASSKRGQYYKECEEEFMKIHKEVEEKKKKSAYSLVFGYTYPNCDLDGTYSPVQENRTHKFCVDKKGNILTKALEKANDAMAEMIENMNCKCARASLVMTTAEKPTCLDNGNYNHVQCRRGICRCVDSDGHQKCTEDMSVCEVEERLSADLSCT